MCVRGGASLRLSLLCEGGSPLRATDLPPRPVGRCREDVGVPPIGLLMHMHGLLLEVYTVYASQHNIRAQTPEETECLSLEDEAHDGPPGQLREGSHRSRVEAPPVCNRRSGSCLRLIWA